MANGLAAACAITQHLLSSKCEFMHTCGASAWRGSSIDSRASLVKLVSWDKLVLNQVGKALTVLLRTSNHVATLAAEARLYPVELCTLQQQQQRQQHWDRRRQHWHQANFT
jgi:hypothetical protein